MEVFAGDADDRRLLPVDPDRAADRIGIGVQTRPPEALAHHGRRQTTAALEIGMEKPSEEGLSAERREVLERDQVSGNALGMRRVPILQGQVERNGTGVRGGGRGHVAQVAVTLEVGEGDRALRRDQFRRFRARRAAAAGSWHPAY